VRASAMEFRLRLLINLFIVVLGFWAPWIEAWGIGRRTPLLEGLAGELSRSGGLTFAASVAAVNSLAILAAALGVILRVWGSAYLGVGTVQDPQMQAGALTAAGPYRYVRNPLYLGLWFMFAALAFLMPASGAIVAMALCTLFQLRLILAEEAFLTARLGDPYRNYLKSVPRLFPRLRTNLPHADAKPAWTTAALSELTPIAVFVAMAALSWTYDRELMARAILIGFGLSLIVRALIPGVRQKPV
jgi:protein-S-isoprenylcysteine O-methyltransferase Ste14